MIRDRGTVLLLPEPHSLREQTIVSKCRQGGRALKIFKIGHCPVTPRKIFTFSSFTSLDAKTTLSTLSTSQSHRGYRQDPFAAFQQAFLTKTSFTFAPHLCSCELSLDLRVWLLVTVPRAGSLPFSSLSAV